jgi:hypothetical protein
MVLTWFAKQVSTYWYSPGLSLVGVSCGSSGINGTGDTNTLSLPNTSVGGAPRGPVGAGEGTTWRSLSEASLITVALSNGATERASSPRLWIYRSGLIPNLQQAS